MKITLEARIPLEYNGMRLDAALAKCFPDYSRAQLTQWLKAGDILINGNKLLPKHKAVGDEHVILNTELAELSDHAEDLPLDIVYEDEHILVINKPKNCVVHPGAGNREGTLLNALLYHAPELKHLPRAGIIHRLDKDTTGLMVVTKSQAANRRLIDDMKDRKITRRYYALVKGEFISGGKIDAPIGRHRTNRLKMTVMSNGKPSVTHYKVKKRFKGYTWMDVQLETGRTHQIRVHFSHQQHPLIGDPLYKARGILSSDLSAALREKILNFPRPALHAYHLALTHPVTEALMAWEQPIPDDMQEMIRDLTHEHHHTGMADTKLD